MSEQLRNLVREVTAGDLSASTLARVFRAKAHEGDGEAVAALWSGWADKDSGLSYDTKEVFKYAEGWTAEDVDRVLWDQEGENDGREWAALCLLKDGRWSFVEAGCDYTGWG